MKTKKVCRTDLRFEVKNWCRLGMILLMIAGVMGLTGTARAEPVTSSENPNPENITINDGVTPAQTGDPVIWVYPTNNAPPSGTIIVLPKFKPSPPNPANTPNYSNGQAFSINDKSTQGRLPVRFYMKTTSDSEGQVDGYADNVAIDISPTTVTTAAQVGMVFATAVNNYNRNLLHVNAIAEVTDGRVYLSYDFTSDTDSNGNDVEVTNDRDKPLPSSIFSSFSWSKTSNPSNDVRNVQWAINNVQPGGTVVLKQYAANTANPLSFNFGVIGGVVTYKDVTLQGEFRGSREDLDGVGYGGWIQEGTTIKGGTFVVRVQRQLPNPGPSFAVKDIIFDGPRNRAFGVGDMYGTGEISGCKIINLMPGTKPGVPTGAFWMIVHGGTAEDKVNSLTGTLKIKNNFLGKPVNADGSQANNINSLTHFSNCILELEISGNEIEDCIWGGFLVILNQGHTLIARNKVTKTRSNRQLQGAAISIGAYPSGAGSLFTTNYSYEGSADIIDNEVIVGSPTTDPVSTTNTTNSYGILICNYPPNQFPYAPDGTGPLSKQIPVPSVYKVSGNRVTMYRNLFNNGLNPSAIGIIGSASNITCLDNTVKGEANYGIQLTRVLPSFMVAANADAFLVNNNFSGNDLEGFTAGIAQVYLDQFTKDNFFGPGTYPYTGISYHGNVFGPLQLTYDMNQWLNPPTNTIPNLNYHKLLTLSAYVDGGTNNICQHNDFTQSNDLGTVNGLDVGIPNPYPDEWPEVIDYVTCISLGPTSSYAKVYEHPKLGTKYFPTGTSMCNQISWDQNSTNVVHLWDTYCAENPPNKNLDEIWARWEAHQAWQNQFVSSPLPNVTWSEYQDLSGPGYAWNEETQQWELSEQ